MLFVHNPAKGGTSGPQACFLAGKRIAKVKGVKSQKDIDKTGRQFYISFDPILRLCNEGSAPGLLHPF
jgi:hypothetical protein